MDPENRVVALCARGMEAETEGRPALAKQLFLEAWEAAADDYEACIAAHYVARHQDTDADGLHWNREALRRADLVPDDRVQGFYPSLHLNLGYSLERAGRLDEARRHYELAAARLGDVPEGPYGNLVRTGVAGGLGRTEPGRAGPDA